MNTPKRRRPAVNLVDFDSVGDEEKAALRERARAAVAKEQQEKTADVLYLKYLDEERRALDPKQEMKIISLDMAGHSDRIALDGVVFFHGITYEVPRTVYESLREVVANGWRHEEEIGGSNRDQYRKPKHETLNRHGQVSQQRGM